MRTFFRPYFKSILVAGGASVSVELNDSSGTPLGCNFVNIDTSGDTTMTNNYIVVEPSGMLTGVPVGPSGVVEDGASSVNGSGVLGAGCKASGGTTQLVLGAGDRVFAINISNYGVDTTNTNCLITYGNVMTENTFKSNIYPAGS
jgi:hypothetical protein